MNPFKTIGPNSSHNLTNPHLRYDRQIKWLDTHKTCILRLNVSNLMDKAIYNCEFYINVFHH